jgi:hypothetical protein
VVGLGEVFKFNHEPYTYLETMITLL